MQLWMIHNNETVGGKIKHPGTVLVFLYCHIMSCMSQLNLKTKHMVQSSHPFQHVSSYAKGFCHLILLEHLTHSGIVYQISKDF